MKIRCLQQYLQEKSLDTAQLLELKVIYLNKQIQWKLFS